MIEPNTLERLGLLAFVNEYVGKMFQDSLDGLYT